MDFFFGGRHGYRGVGSTLAIPMWFHCFLISLYWNSLGLVVVVQGAGLLRGPPRILSSELKPLQVVRLGQELRVTCPVEGEPSPIVDWYKDDEPITLAWFRYRFNGKTLRIRPVLAEDSGMIECKGVNGFGSQIAKMRLLVVDDAGTPEQSVDNISSSRKQRLDSSKSSFPAFSPETLEQAGPMHLSSGNTIRLRCEAKGSPMPRIAWFKDGKAVGDGDNMWRLSSWTLILPKLVVEDSGNYTCKTDGRKPIQFSTQLHVTETVEKKRPELASGFPNNTSVLAGNEAILECVVRGGFTTMPPHIKWLKRVSESQHTMGSHNNNNNKHRLIPVENQHVLVIQETQGDGIRIRESQKNGTFVSKLIISRTELADGGIYICLATNNVGYTFKEAHLRVAAPEITGGQDASSRRTQSSLNPIPLPLIVILLSISVALLVIGAAYLLRKHHEHRSKQIKTLSPSTDNKKVLSGGRTASIHSSSVTNSSSYHHHHLHHHPAKLSLKSSGCEQQQLLVSTTSTHSSSTSSSYDHHHHLHHHRPGQSQREPIVEIPMSRCSCYGDPCSDTGSTLPTPPTPLRSTFGGRTVPGYNNNFRGDSTNQSLHFGHWT